ncbi:MAG: heme NO-binding domain-containing protein [Candidatus Synoicihabitans palmerolidicus]|nr:heme NO-binding domain-containing protein [Candidatus Synoicihabitans palmerolidicus]
MVNKEIEDMVCEVHGEDAWELIKTNAGVDVDVFISNEGYPDDYTYRLVAVASEVSNTPAEVILEAFGEHCVLRTALEGYGDLMHAGGDNLKNFLINLPYFHTRVVMIYPKLQPPHFEISDLQDRELHLHYHTHHNGLSHFVVGLLRCLGKMFKTPTIVTQIASRPDGAHHDSFRVQW